MREPQELVDARQCLARAEAELRCKEALTHLADGLALLDDVIGAGSPDHARTAKNLARTYATKIYNRIEQLVETDRGLPEPELEHFFKLVLAFDTARVELPQTAQALKIGVVRRLIHRYYEGHPPEAKERALRELERLGND
jgi:hypothetical protein